MLSARIRSVGLIGPGLPDFSALKAHAPGVATAIPTARLLPPREERRASDPIRLAIEAATQAIEAAGVDGSDIATVFAASTSEEHNCHELCSALDRPARQVSPTRFSNSVHNAASGYWHIAVGSRMRSTSIAAHDDTFAAGLLEATAQCVDEGRPVLLVAFDVPAPAPMLEKRPMSDAFGVALLLSQQGPGASISVSLDASPSETRCRSASLEAVRAGIPAARALPLLEVLDGGGTVSIGGLAIEVR